MKLFDRLTTPVFWLTIAAFLVIVPPLAPIGNWLGANAQSLVDLFTAVSVILGSLGVFSASYKARAFRQSIGDEPIKRFEAQYYGE